MTDAALLRHDADDVSLPGEMLKTLPIGLGLYDAQQHLLQANAAFGSAIGMHPETLRAGSSLAEHLRRAGQNGRFTPPFALPPAPPSATLPGWAVLALPACTLYHRADGQRFTLHATRAQDGHWVLCACPAAAEEAAESPVRLAEAAIAALPIGVAVFGADRRLRLANPRFSALLGLQDHRLDRGTGFARLARMIGVGGPAEAHEAAVQLAGAMDSNGQTTRRQQLLRADGGMITVATTGLAGGGWTIVLTEGEPAPTVMHATSETLLASLHHGIILWDSQHRIIAANAQAAELLDLPTALFAQGHDIDAISATLLARGHAPPAPNPPGRGAPPRPPPGGGPPAGRRPGRAGGICPLPTAAGRRLEIRSEPAPAGGGVSILTDLTEAHASEAALRRAKAAAEAANQAKSRFLATMSHELRTPLNAVIGFSDALTREDEATDPAQVAEFAAAINRSGRQLLTLINNILDVARIEAGRFELAADRIDLTRLVAACAQAADAAAQAAEIVLDWHVPDDLPLLTADERRIRQVMAHLLSNAVKFTGAGGTVTIAAELAEDGALRLIVRDSGIGIAATDLDHVFEPFSQVDASLARRFQGAGLGLYVSRALVRAHGGDLTLSSQTGQGTTAELRLPPERLARPGDRIPPTLSRS